MRTQLMRRLSGALLGGLLALAAASAGAAGAPLTLDSSPIWDQLRGVLFGDRPISTEAGPVLALDAPVRADDAAIVPVSIRTPGPGRDRRFVRKIYLVIDGNPSPVAAIFTFAPDSGRADIETRVRIEQYTPIRAIAEMDDGELFMAARFIKASGGCSAPAGKDQAAALANVGKMRLRLDREVTLGEPNLVQLMISHPNTSGLAMDQLTRLYAPPYFVKRVEVSYDGQPVMSADVDFSISENPNFRFYFVPRAAGELSARVVDTKGIAYSARLAVDPVAPGGQR